MNATATQRLVARQWRTFFDWWTAELAGLGRTVLARLWPAVGGHVSLDLSESGLADLLAGTLALPKPRSRLLARLGVVVPASSVLTRNVTLPSAAEAKLREVIELQYARLMPLKRDAVLLDHRIVSRDAAKGTIDVEVGILKKELAGAVAAASQRAGFRTWTIGTAPDAGLQFTGAGGVGPSGRLRRVELVLEILVAVLAVAFVASRIFGWALHEAAVQKEIAQVEQHAAVASRISKDLEKRAQLVQQLEQVIPRPSLPEVLAELTRVLPKDAWVYEFFRKGPSVRLAGMAANGADIALKLEESPMLSDVKVGSLTQTGMAGTARFELTLTLGEGGQP